MATIKLLVSFDYVNNFLVVRDYTDDRNHGTLKLIDTASNDAARLLTIINTNSCKRVEIGSISGYVIDKSVVVFNINARMKLGLSELNIIADGLAR
jgi:hypothetical protein